MDKQTREQQECEKVFGIIDELMNKTMELDPVLTLAYIPTLFDIVCEKMKLDKMETWERIGELIKIVNKEEGPMFPKSN